MGDWVKRVGWEAPEVYRSSRVVVRRLESFPDESCAPGAAADERIRRSLAASDVRAVFTENHFWTLTWTLLYWDAIFAKIPGSFEPLCGPEFPVEGNDIPRDLFRDGFLSAHETLYRDRRSELTHADLGTELRKGRATSSKGWTRLVQDSDRLPEKEVITALERLPNEAVLKVLDRLWENYGEMRRGLPDLLLLDPSPVLIEVKSPTERVRPEQLAWLKYMASECGLATEVLLIAWSDRKIANLAELLGPPDAPDPRVQQVEGAPDQTAPPFTDEPGASKPESDGHAEESTASARESVANEQRMPLAVNVELDPLISFAMQQNDVPIVKLLHLQNTGDATLRDIELTIEPEPEFARGWSTRIDAIAAGARFNLDDVDLALSPTYLAEATERTRGCLNLTVSNPDGVLHQERIDVEVLPRDQWNGGRSLPELLAAFVMPNHPRLRPVLKKAAERLEAWSGDSALSGYQQRSAKRVQLIAAAVFSAIQETGLTYINPPASFESEGQRVRTPGRLFDDGMGTCLDLAVLASACLEQCGLHALLVLVEGHAFCGVWLDSESFADPVTYDVLPLRKSIELGRITVFDPTLATRSDRPDFDTAVAEARQHVDRDDSFSYVIDVRRSRIGRITPLPERVEGGESEPVDQPPPRTGPSEAPNLGELDLHEVLDAADAASQTETPIGRLERWQSKLLDLSLRNRLLNFKATKKVVPFLCHDVGALEDQLAAGTVFNIGCKPGDLALGDPRDAEVHRRRTGDDATRSIIEEEFALNRLRTNLDEHETQTRLTEIYRSARTSMEEGGASELFLVVGMLKWYESDTSETPRMAPLLLLPASLVRPSVHGDFRLKSSDEDAKANITLLEKLEREFGIRIPGLDPLPEDEAGLDIPLILRKFKKAIAGVKRWEVVEQVWVGLFSFKKFLMWRDLTARTGELLENPVVDHLVNRPKEPFQTTGDFPRADRLDAERKPAEVFCPKSADSSQLAAVMAAADGRTFVLEGPPGTGKSQTITNLIAHCLATEKRVLFVSEKMAALNVVQRRLEEIGLGRFCLELHSNKASKNQVLAQLKDALDGASSRTPDEWQREASRLEALRNQLNAYVEALHLERTSGETVYQVTSRLVGLRQVRRLPMRWSSPDDVGAERLSHLRDTIQRLCTAAEACGNIADHAWRAVRETEFRPTWQSSVLETISHLQSSTVSLRDGLAELAGPLLIDPHELSLLGVDPIGKLCRHLLEHPRPPKTLLVEQDWDVAQEMLEAWIVLGRERDAARDDIFERYAETVRDLDTEDLLGELRVAEASAWPLSWWRRRPVKYALRKVSKSGRAPDNKHLSDELTAIGALSKLEAQVRDAGEDARRLLEQHWCDGEADWDGLSSIRKWARQFRVLAQELSGGDSERATALRAAWASLATGQVELLAEGQPLRASLELVASLSPNFMEALSSCNQVLDLDARAAWGEESAAGAISSVLETTERWNAATPRLREWCHWRGIRTEAASQELRLLLEALESGEIESAELSDGFERSYAQWWYEAVLDTEPVLARFSSAEHERAIRDFVETDERYTKLTKQVIAARLASQVPAASTGLRSSELGILSHEVSKKRRHKPVRRLFEEIPNLLPRLKPCLLMSPISIAQYLDPSFPKFDVVVFDEASQIPVWDAIGALARGRQAVIVGDPKQLPPTRFFQNSDDGDDDELSYDVVEDQESILDDCLAAQLPWLHLDWHYRSRHESLIAFSNHHYYENKLLTFPAAEREGLGVTWRHVPEGVYDRGKSRTNRAEADTLVAEVTRRLTDPALKHETIGVVTFSQTQQRLVEQLLDEARGKHSEIEFAFSDDQLEPVFVKNLENVQGDERDVILFSIGYGPDAQGRVYMNFGPLTGQGGERRLNVAITRARREVVVFSTLRSEHIDLNRTKSRGVRDLKTFLDYAERGMAAIAEATHFRGLEDYESPFEEQVAKALIDRGWDIHAQVGCSNYRIDLAVIDPDVPGRYLLGVECDGAYYHSAKTARDRDRLRESVLADLGWQLHRIWSTDWWNDPQREIEKLESALLKAQAKSTASSVVAPPESGDRVAESMMASPIASVGGRSSSDTDNPVASPTSLNSAREESHIVTYRAAVGLRAPRDSFYESRGASHIVRLFELVTSAEAPVLFELAAKRVGDAFGMGRVTSKAVTHMQDVLGRHEHRGIKVRFVAEEETTVLWRLGDEPELWSEARAPGSSQSDQRSIDEVPLVELCAGVRKILGRHISAPEEDLASETARLFGVRRLGAKVRARMEQAISRCIAQGHAERSGSMIVII